MPHTFACSVSSENLATTARLPTLQLQIVSKKITPRRRSNKRDIRPSVMTNYDRPNTIPWPPLLMVILAAIALALNWMLPTNQWLTPVSSDIQRIGTVVALCAVMWDVWAMLTMWRAKTNILPHRAADKIVAHGPFSYSRNPIYLGNTIMLAGLAFALGNLWFLLAAVDFAVLVHYLAIKREENHMALRFGEAWEQYKERVPRWALGL